MPLRRELEGDFLEIVGSGVGPRNSVKLVSKIATFHTGDRPTNRRNSVKLVSKKDRVQKGGILNIGLNQKRRPLLSALSDFHRSHVDPFRQRRGISPRF